MKFNDIRVSTRLWGGILGLLFIAVAVGGWSQWHANRVADTALDSVRDYEQRISDGIAWRGATETVGEQVISSNATADSVLQAQTDARVKAGVAAIGVLQKVIVERPGSVADKAALADAARERVAVLALNRQMRELQQASSSAAVPAEFIEKTYLPAIGRYVGALDAFVKLQEQQRDAAIAELQAARQRALVLSLAGMLLVLAAGVALAALLARSMARPLAQAVGMAQAIAAGDLRAAAQSDRRDEFGQLQAALATMVQKLRAVVGEVRGGIESVSTASQQIAAGNHDLSGRTEQAAANLEQTAASMEELTGTVTQSTDTAHRARQLASGAAQAASRGGEVMDEVVASMGQISGSSRRIGDIIGTIDGIAFQTNILALNAAVEAARAGEQGRGFAVVASEVRNLAQRSAQAAREIKTLIGASVDTVDTGARQVSQAGQAMGEIVHGVRQVADLIAEIHAASSEQRDGIAQVNQAVAQLDQMTQQNAALVEESAAAATALRDQAGRLSQAIAVFRLDDGPEAMATGPRAEPPVLRQRVASTAPRAPTAAASKPPASRPPARALAAPAPAAVRAPAPSAAQATAGGDDAWESF